MQVCDGPSVRLASEGSPVKRRPATARPTLRCRVGLPQKFENRCHRSLRRVDHRDPAKPTIDGVGQKYVHLGEVPSTEGTRILSGQLLEPRPSDVDVEPPAALWI